MAQETVTRAEMRAIPIGETRTFKLEDAKRLTSVSVQANQLKNEEGLEFRVSKNYQERTVEILRVR